MSSAVLETTGLGKRYGQRWALKDCSLRLPPGRVAALIGANGAGKSTLLNLAVGLSRPTTGAVHINGVPVRYGSADVLPDIGFVAQDVPLYGTFTPEELLRAGAALNRVFDAEIARARWRELGIQPDQKVATMSGGQRAQVALALALAKHPSVLLLDEPLASLDPLARHEFLQTLMAAVAESGVTVLLSSHLLAELERVCDWVIVLGRGRVQVAGDVEELVASHWWVRTATGRDAHIDAGAVIDERSSGRETISLVRGRADLDDTLSKPTLEELILAYLGNPEAVALPGPEVLEGTR